MRRNHARNVLLWMALALVAVSAVAHPAATYLGRKRFPHEVGPRPVPGMKTAPKGADEMRAFATHLPIVVVEFEKEPGRHAAWDAANDYTVPVPGDPYTEGIFCLYDDPGSGENRLSDSPALKTKVRARLRGRSSIQFPKKQFLIKMYDDRGAEKEVDILGMGKAAEWILNISHIDKSLMRNYMCLQIASRIMGYAPETRYCEAFRKRGDEYEYLGLYLLMEPVSRGKSRINLTKYNPRHAKTSYLLRRDRYQVDGVVLDNFAAVHRLANNFLEVKYPSKRRITAKTITFIEDDINRIEKALYSEDRTEFLKYRDYIDTASFIDYFLINEFFGNYDAQQNSVYMHKDLNERLKMGPVWDFDQAIGNNEPFGMDPSSAAMQIGVWLDRLLHDGKFLYRLEKRYHQLRKGILSEKYLFMFMDEVTKYLGDAIDRDWDRWRYDDPYALPLAEGDVLHPNALVKRANHEEEMDAIKRLLHEHGEWLDKNIGSVFGRFTDLDYF